MPVLEIALFPASNAHIADQTIMDPALAFAAKVEGSIGIYRGIQLEDKKTALLAIVWETYEHHKRMMERDDYKDVIALLTPSFAGSLDLQHVDFQRDVRNGLDARVTELTLLDVKPEAKDTFSSYTKDLFNELETAKGCHRPIAGAFSRENPETFALLIGWDSLEGHQEEMKKPGLAGAIEKIQTATKGARLMHFELRKYK